ncbi:hypothetical protein [Paenibacillus sp. 8b26]
MNHTYKKLETNIDFFAAELSQERVHVVSIEEKLRVTLRLWRRG